MNRVDCLTLIGRLTSVPPRYTGTKGVSDTELSKGHTGHTQIKSATATDDEKRGVLVRGFDDSGVNHSPQNTRLSAGIRHLWGLGLCSTSDHNVQTWIDIPNGMQPNFLVVHKL
jgi:hypothetical protein